MSQALQAVERVKAALRTLPGIGPKAAERITFHLLKSAPAQVHELANALTDLTTRVRHCRQCFNLAEAELCPICADPKRDQAQVFIVEQPKDVILLEQAGVVRGVYHVLLGRISPLDRIEPEDLTIPQLLERARQPGIRELVFALNPTVEGDATASYIAEHLGSANLQLTRLARGLSTGGQLEFTSRASLAEAIIDRRHVDPDNHPTSSKP